MTLGENVGRKAGLDTEEELDKDVVKWLNIALQMMKTHKVKFILTVEEKDASDDKTNLASNHSDGSGISSDS